LNAFGESPNRWHIFQLLGSTLSSEYLIHSDRGGAPIRTLARLRSPPAGPVCCQNAASPMTRAAFSLFYFSFPPTSDGLACRRRGSSSFVLYLPRVRHGFRKLTYIIEPRASCNVRWVLLELVRPPSEFQSLAQFT
jgi:hypothetical protein